MLCYGIELLGIMYLHAIGHGEQFMGIFPASRQNPVISSPASEISVTVPQIPDTCMIGALYMIPITVPEIHMTNLIIKSSMWGQCAN